MTLTQTQASALKGLLVGVLALVAHYFSISSNVAPFAGDALSVVIASFFAGLESVFKQNSEGTTALFGAVTLK